MNHRISAGALIMRDSEILLVRHSKPGAYDFWVAPGGGVMDQEDAAATAEREAREETGFMVKAARLIVVEEMTQPDQRMCKLWFWCDLIDGQLSVDAPEARREHIVEAGFFSRDSLVGKTVFPPVLSDDWFWSNASNPKTPVCYLPVRELKFY